jgi:hypothetical protein
VVAVEIACGKPRRNLPILLLTPLLSFAAYPPKPVAGASGVFGKGKLS